LQAKSKIVLLPGMFSGSYPRWLQSVFQFCVILFSIIAPKALESSRSEILERSSSNSSATLFSMFFDTYW
jgi:hypothetical protein